jgi:hypothetical protein
MKEGEEMYVLIEKYREGWHWKEREIDRKERRTERGNIMEQCEAELRGRHQRAVDDEGVCVAAERSHWYVWKFLWLQDIGLHNQALKLPMCRDPTESCPIFTNRSGWGGELSGQADEPSLLRFEAPPPLRKPPSDARRRGDARSARSGSIAPSRSPTLSFVPEAAAETFAALSGRIRDGSTWKGRPKEKEVVGGAAAIATTSSGVEGNVKRSEPETTFEGAGTVPACVIAGEG